MKVLHVINSLAAGGAEKLVSSLAKEQSKKDEIAIFSFDSTNDIFSNFSGTNVKHYTTTSNSYYSLKNSLFLYKLIKKYDIIHVHLFPSFYIVALLSLFLKNKKFYYTEHNTINRRRNNLIFKPLERIIYLRYNHIICITDAVKDIMDSWLGRSYKKSVILNFFDPNEIDLQIPIDRTSIGLKDSDKAIVMVGSFRNNQKDQLTLVKLIMTLPEEFKLVLIGDGILRNKLEQFVFDNNLRDRVIFLGVKKQVYSILKVCDYGVLSSNWEGFGIAALEYMACDLIALGTNVDGLNQVIPLKENLFEIGDYKTLANKILYYEQNTEISDSVKKIQSEFIKKFEIAQAVEKHKEIYI